MDNETATEDIKKANSINYRLSCKANKKYLRMIDGLIDSGYVEYSGAWMPSRFNTPDPCIRVTLKGMLAGIKIPNHPLATFSTAN